MWDCDVIDTIIFITNDYWVRKKMSFQKIIIKYKPLKVIQIPFYALMDQR